MSDNDMCLGTCKWWNDDKGYGFIRLPGGELDIFVHANQLRKAGILDGLKEGERLAFKIGKGAKGTYATDIKRA